MVLKSRLSRAIMAVAFLLIRTAIASDRPNVVLIFTDNHSSWTLGAYGNQEIRTPHIDRLASQGILFRNAFTANPVCSPNRATLLTGLMPSQHGVHSFLSTQDGQMGPGAHCAIEEFRSLAEILAESGYQCGLTGKWHLGDSLRPQEGFTYWYTIEYGGAPFYDANVIWQGKVQKEPRYLTEAITEHAIDFIEQNRTNPFFLYLAYNGPYGLGGEFRKTHHNRHTTYYADQVLRSFPREALHPWLYANRDIINNPASIRSYAAAVSGIDDGVGRILETLARLGLEKNTLVIFTSDQGLAGGHHGIWGMGDHTRPSADYEEMIRIPLMYRHPEKISAGTVSDLIVSIYDTFPTLLSYLGLAHKAPSDPPPPGRDYSAALVGKELDWDNVIFYEFENLRMIRTADWKYTYRFPDGPHDLYDMKNTPGERVNFIHQAEYKEIQEMLAKRLEAFFDRYADPKYDLLHGGRSKARIHMMK